MVLTKGVLYRSMVFLLVAVMVMGFSLPHVAQASESAYSAEEMREINKIQEELRFYFEEVGELTEQGYVVKNEKLFQERLTAGDPSAIKLTQFMATKYYSGAADIQPMGVADFGKCVVNKFVDSYGTIARGFLTGAIFTYIKNQEYKLAAKLIAQTLVKAGFKVNAAGIAIEAATYGWQCRGEL
ncbi:hypothetical protein [Paenibacillus thiaminolyticus]|uniref:hypothetical protein n=1 Tax=Paenibacillus thiaminolyticus TaxID=49283 RepID=UPI002542D64F|nr:hypothetical protein [Paenibacillus thiaminolyticus]WII38590.1 hypothetical protein O0V01_05525 [Paenibacillus thiaminolyticus]